MAKTIKELAEPEVIIGIDSSTWSVAFSVFKNKALIQYGKVVFEGRTVYDRAGDASKKCSQLFECMPGGLVVIEKAVVVNNRTTAMELSFMQGAIIGSMQQHNHYEIRSVTPRVWQYAIGNGAVTDYRRKKIREANPGHTTSFYNTEIRKFRKQRTIKIINGLYCLDVDDDDVADAIGVGHYSLEHWRTL